MATIAELQRRQGDLQLLIASFETRLSQRQQQLDQTRRLIAENQETIPRIERALARAQAAGDSARVAQIESDLSGSRATATELSAIESRELAALEQTQTALNNARQDLASLETQIKTSTDQGPKTNSAGAETLDEQRGKAEGAVTQNPATAIEQQSTTGEISASPLRAVPTNAESSQPRPVPEVANGPPAAVQTSPTAQNQLPGTPTRGQSVLQPPSPSGAQQFSIYKAITVTSNFSGGKFTQDLEGLLLQIPVTGARRQGDVLVPLVPASFADDITLLSQLELPVTPVETQTRPTQTATVIPGDQIQSQAPQSDATVYGPATTAPPDSDGQSVAVAQPSSNDGEGSATPSINLARET